MTFCLCLRLRLCCRLVGHASSGGIAIGVSDGTAAAAAAAAATAAGVGYNAYCATCAVVYSWHFGHTLDHWPCDVGGQSEFVPVELVAVATVASGGGGVGASSGSTHSCSFGDMISFSAGSTDLLLLLLQRQRWRRVLCHGFHS